MSTDSSSSGRKSEDDGVALPGLNGKIAIVTGSTAGIGLAIAQQLAQSGCKVVVNGRSQASCKKACKEIEQSITNKDLLIPVPGDVSSAEGVASFLQAAQEALASKQEDPSTTTTTTAGGASTEQHVDILINNVGFFETKDFFEITDEEWVKYHEVNLMSGIRLCRALLPAMLERKSGRCIFVSSEAGVRTLPHMIPYSVSKASQIAVARGLAELTKGVPGVTINSLLPGPTWTTGAQNYMKGFAESKNVSIEEAIKSYFKEFEPNSLLQRFLEPSEVAAVAAFLCSDLASGVNGTAQRVEGGIIRHT